MLPAGRRTGPAGPRTSVRPAALGGSVGGRWTRIATVCWAGLIVVGFGAGALLRAAGALPVDPFPPLHAHPRFTVLPLLPAAALGLAAVVVLPAAARRLAWRPLLAAGWLGSAAWAVTLALPEGLSTPLTARTEYLAGLPAIGADPLRWLRGFTRALPSYPTHVKGHPPLPTLILWTLEQAGLRGPGWAATLVIAAGTSATVAIALTVRALAGEDTARRAVPFLVLAPTALWVATSMDAFFLGAGAWAVALATRAARPAPVVRPAALTAGVPGSAAAGVAVRRGVMARAVAAGLAGGLLLGALPYLSYGLLSFFALPLAALTLARPSRPVIAALAAGFAVVPAAFTLAGFSWWDGMIGTHAAWAAGAGSRRPYAYFLVGDLAVLALLVGPATARALPSALAHAASLVRPPPGGGESARAPSPAGAPPGGSGRTEPGAAASSPAADAVVAGSTVAVRPGAESAGTPRPAASRVHGARPNARRGGPLRAVLAYPDRLIRGDRASGAGALGLLVAAALAGMAALDLSGVTRGEVERIWIPYAAWVVAANAVHRKHIRTLLSVQVVAALVIEALVRSPW